MELSGYTYVYSGSFLFLCIFDTIYISSDRIYKDAAKNGRMVALHLGVQAQFTIDGKLCRSYTDKEKAYDNFKL